MWIPVFAFTVSIAATLVASIYPARFALKTNPADALRVV
jgi:ABC-type antimicrobial peptide transport system permease subunit